jgi:intergrase/recombinase
MNRAERYQNTLRGNSRVNTQAALARKLGISKARLTQIMNLLKLAPEIKSYIKKLDDQELLHFFNEEFKKIKKACFGVFGPRSLEIESLRRSFSK